MCINRLASIVLTIMMATISTARMDDNKTSKKKTIYNAQLKFQLDSILFIISTLKKTASIASNWQVSFFFQLETMLLHFMSARIAIGTNCKTELTNFKTNIVCDRAVQ